VWLGGLFPASMIAWRAATGALGADPIAEALNGLGNLAIKCLLLCLACTPARILTGATWPLRVRKHLGLLAFTYVLLHFGVYVLVDRAGELGTVLEDITKRPFIVVGFSAFLLLLPLAATSSKAAIRRLGGKRWNRLHKLVYLIAILAVVHFIMRAKKDITEAALHGAVLVFLLGVRIVDKLRRSSKQRTPLTQ
jgi:methionine sulfoxide reductase heme-binding subunit